MICPISFFDFALGFQSLSRLSMNVLTVTLPLITWYRLLTRGKVQWHRQEIVTVATMVVRVVNFLKFEVSGSSEIEFKNGYRAPVILQNLVFKAFDMSVKGKREVFPSRLN